MIDGKMILTQSDLARYLSVSRAYVSRLLKESPEKLPPQMEHQFTKKPRWHADTVEAFYSRTK